MYCETGLSLDFSAAKPKKQKSCMKGFSCGYSCISKTKTCGDDLPSEAKTYADYALGLIGKIKAKIFGKPASSTAAYPPYAPLERKRSPNDIHHQNTLPLGKNVGLLENLEWDPEDPKDAAHPERQVKNYKEISDAITKATGFDKPEAIQAMRDALRWAQFGYKGIRAAQAGREAEGGYVEFKDKADAQRAASQLDRLIAKLPKFSGPIYRGLQFQSSRDADAFIAKLQADGGLKLDTLTSWTSSKDKGESFATGNKGTSGVIFQVENRSHGASISQLSPWSESEVLVKTNAQYKVKTMQRRKLGLLGRRAVWDVVLEEDSQ